MPLISLIILIIIIILIIVIVATERGSLCACVSNRRDRGEGWERSRGQWKRRDTGSLRRLGCLLREACAHVWLEERPRKRLIG